MKDSHLRKQPCKRKLRGPRHQRRRLLESVLLINEAGKVLSNLRGSRESILMGWVKRLSLLCSRSCHQPSATEWVRKVAALV